MLPYARKCDNMISPAVRACSLRQKAAFGKQFPQAKQPSVMT
jgi:hypothetical protein